MPTLEMYGASDDLVETEGIPGCDEFDCYNESPRFLVSGPGGCLWIVAHYHGSWAFAVGSAANNCEAMPPWPIRRSWGDNCAYSETLTIECPAGTTIRRCKGDN